MVWDIIFSERTRYLRRLEEPYVRSKADQGLDDCHMGSWWEYRWRTSGYRFLCEPLLHFQAPETDQACQNRDNQKLNDYRWKKDGR